MKRTKYLITYIIGLLVLSISISVVFAAFVFNQVATVTGNFGGITIVHKDFYDYSYNKASNDKKVSKLRKDTVAIIDNIILASTDTYELTSDQVYVDGKAYYNNSHVLLKPYVNDETAYDYEVGDAIPASTVYELKKQYTGLSSVGTCQYYNTSSGEFTDLVKTVNTNSISFTVNTVSVTITCTVNQNAGVISTATVTTNSETAHYRTQLDVDGLGMLVLDDDITSSSTDGYSVIDASTAITCSASEDKYYTEAEKTAGAQHPYLSQLGLHFEFKAEIAVYVRIHIRDAWEKIKEYTTSSRETYTIKDQVSGQSPFTVNDSEWYYDEDTNCVYLKQMYVPQYDNAGNLISKEYTFNVNEAYFYQVASTTAYTEYVNVQVSFTIDIVQANRAKALWKLDPSTIGQ